MDYCRTWVFVIRVALSTIPSAIGIADTTGVHGCLVSTTLTGLESNPCQQRQQGVGGDRYAGARYCNTRSSSSATLLVNSVSVCRHRSPFQFQRLSFCGVFVFPRFSCFPGMHDAPKSNKFSSCRVPFAQFLDSQSLTVSLSVSLQSQWQQNLLFRFSPWPLP